MSRRRWPSPVHYQEALQYPEICFTDPELQQATPVRDALGLPRPIAGQFVSVYDLRRREHRWAVRCFHRHSLGLEIRYGELARVLPQIDLPYFVPFVYSPGGILAAGERWPILCMEWVEGELLSEYIERHLMEPRTLLALCDSWTAMAADLENAGIAHGDLQHGNVIVEAGGALRLIDYDGMYVPALRSLGSGETGHPSYQHPRRSVGDWGAHIDRFSLLSVYVTLKALSRQFNLWYRFHNGDNLLFSREDLASPGKSPVFAAIHGINDPELKRACAALATACRASIDRTPDLRGFAGQSVLPDWLTGHVRGGKSPQPAADAESRKPDGPVESRGATALAAAVRDGDRAALERLLSLEPESVNGLAPGGSTPLHAAAYWGRIELLDSLLQHAASVDAADREGRTPLHLAAFAGHASAAARLLAAGAAVDARNHGRQTPLHYAALAGHAEVVALLLRYGATPGAPDRSGRTARDIAEGRGDAAVLAAFTGQ